MEGEDDGPQVLQADHGDVAVNPRDLWAVGISRRPVAVPTPLLLSQLLHPDLRWISRMVMRPASFLICSTQRSARPRYAWR